MDIMKFGCIHTKAIVFDNFGDDCAILDFTSDGITTVTFASPFSCGDDFIAIAKIIGKEIDRNLESAQKREEENGKR